MPQTIYTLKYRSGLLLIVSGILVGVGSLFCAALAASPDGQVYLRDQLSSMPSGVGELIFHFVFLRLPIPLVFVSFLAIGVFGTAWCFAAAFSAFRGRTQVAIDDTGVSTVPVFGRPKHIAWELIEQVWRTGDSILIRGHTAAGKPIVLGFAVPKKEFREFKNALARFVPHLVGSL